MGHLLSPYDRAAQPDAEHAAVWDYLSEHVQRYPDGVYVPPMKAGKEGQRGNAIAGLDVVHQPDVGGAGLGVLGCVVSRGGDLRLCDDLRSGDGATRLAAELFTHRARGTSYVVANGGRSGLHLLFRRFYREWIAAGYELGPSVDGTYIKSITVRKDKHSWHLVDLAAFTGLFDMDAESILRAFAGPAFGTATLAARTAVAAGVYAQLVQEHFGVSARLTAARTAVAAASRHLPSDTWLWRPSVLAVTVARIGGGFRGGYFYYPSYRGPGHKIDIRRAYTWALAQPLPLKSALGWCNGDGAERPGLYVCRVQGPGYYPVYLAPWAGTSEGFKRRNWNGDQCVAILPQAEFAGLRALGYRVEPGFGLVTTSTFSFGGFVRQVGRLSDLHGAESATGLVAKSLANCVYGKLAENPFGEYVTFSTERPSAEHLPFCDAAGEEVEDAWSHTRASYRAHQHVDIAAEVTGLVRSRLYEQMARLDAMGSVVRAVDTDGLVCSQDPRPLLVRDVPAIGDWRYCGYDPDVIINGPRFAAWKGRAIIAGTSEQSPDVVAIAHDRGTVTVQGRVMAPAWSPGEMVREVSRTLRRVG